MPESQPSASNTLVWLLAILLIGVVALYTWHNGNQDEILAGKDAEITQSAQLVADTEQKLGLAQQTEQALRGDIDALNTQHAAASQDLTGKLDAAAQANQTLQGEMEALRTQHAQTLAAEQEKASQAYAALQGQHDAASQQIATLGAEIAQQKQAMAAAAAAHEARMTEAQAAHQAEAMALEQQLNEKIAFYRTALEGSDPERAAQLVGLELQVQSDQQTIAEAQQTVQALQEKEVGLSQQLDSANQVIAAREQALTEAGQRLEGLQAELTQGQNALSALQQEHNAAVAQAAEALAAHQQQMQAAEESHAATKADAAAAMQAAEGRISDLTGKLQAETDSLAALQQKHESTVGELTASLDGTKQALAGVESELASAKDAAAQAQRAHEQQIGEAQGKLAQLAGNLEQTQQKAEQDLAASQREGEEAISYVRGVYTEFLKLGGQSTEQGTLLNLAEEDLRFRISKADLPEGDIPSLDSIAEFLNKHPKLTIRIEGHTDSKGREETNLELSQARADAVNQALVDRGVTAERMSSSGIGAERPIADNATSAGRGKNRRVEIYVIEN